MRVVIAELSGEVHFPEVSRRTCVRGHHLVFGGVDLGQPNFDLLLSYRTVRVSPSWTDTTNPSAGLSAHDGKDKATARVAPTIDRGES